MSRRVLLYLRQSDTDGQGERSLSLDSQASELRADATRHDWSIIAEIRDADLKGNDDKRRGLLELYERCRAGDVDVVAFWSLSRLGRSVRIIENVVHELDRLGVDLHSNQEAWVAVPMMRQVVSAFNEQQLRDISAHVRRAFREQARRGISHGPPPFGYERNAERKLIPSEHAETVRRIFRERAAGSSWRTIIEAFHDEGIVSPAGLATWSWRTLGTIVRNPAYRGIVHLSGLSVADAHEALIDDETWFAAQGQAVGRQRAPRVKLASSWAEGLLLHACGRPMYCMAMDGSRQPRFVCQSKCAPYPHCGTYPLSLTACAAEAAIWERLTVDMLVAGRLTTANVLTRARRDYAAYLPATAAAHNAAQKQQNEAVARRLRAEERYLSGMRDRAWLAVEEARALADIADAETQLAQLPAPPDVAAIERALDHLRGIAEWLPAVDDPDARGLALRSLGVAVFGPEGMSIRYRPEYRDVLGSREG